MNAFLPLFAIVLAGFCDAMPQFGKHPAVNLPMMI